MKLYSETFTTVTGMHKAYKAIRENLLQALGFSIEDKIRFSPGCFKFMVEADGGNWLPFSSDKLTVEDFLRMGKHASKDKQGSTFRIETVDMTKLS